MVGTFGWEEWEEMMVDELGDETREIGRDLALRSRIGITFECNERNFGR